MSFEIIKYNPLTTQNSSKYYTPAFTIIKKKLYLVSSWQDLFKILMFSLCYKPNNMDKVLEDQNIRFHSFGDRMIITNKAEESGFFVKFSPALYIRTFSNGRLNCAMLNKVKRYFNTNDYSIYLVRADSVDEAQIDSDTMTQFINELRTRIKFKNGSAKHLIAHINGKVLNKKEKFFRRIEREFDQKVFIGDIDLYDDEAILKQFMHDAIEKIITGNSLLHEKVFAYGMVRTALVHYKEKKYWTHVNSDYSVYLNANDQKVINEAYKRIMKKNNKAYEDTAAYIQNICMHAFVCSECAPQFFNYMFGFWKLDLDCSLENIVDDNGNNLFEIMISEIDKNVQDVMIHTTMALRNNSSGCKNRFRRILKMIDDSFWKGTQYNSSSNRITKLFSEWKDDPQSSFNKELKRRTDERKRGRGEKRLSKPTIVYDPSRSSFQLLLPKQILKDCTESEHLCWYIRIGDKTTCIEPELLRGKSSLFTKETHKNLTDSQIFDEFSIHLKSEIREYSKFVIAKEEYRIFNRRNRCIEIIGGYISKDTRYIITPKDVEIDYLNGDFVDEDRNNTDYDVKYLEPSEGEIIILPNKQAVPIGNVLNEGIVEKYTVSGVNAFYNDQLYSIISKPEKLFIKTTNEKFNGTSLRFYKRNNQIHLIKVSDCNYIEIKLDESRKNSYGYIIDLGELLTKNGFYDIEINVPGRKPVPLKFCLINGFSYTFQNAPFIFSEYGRISFPKDLSVVTDDNWIIKDEAKSLVFTLDEEPKIVKRFVWDRKLKLLYQMENEQVEISFDIPALYWKYDVTDDWSFRHPDDMFKSKMPGHIYIAGGLDLQSAKLVMPDGFSDEYTDISTNKDSKMDLYYFRTVDIRSLFNRDEEYQNINLLINGASHSFIKVYCRSKVRSSSISGDFKKQIIYGYFDILGVSEYMVTIRKDGEIIEEDIPLVDGRFSVECHVTEGTYNVTLYELEDDGSGFGAVSYELQKLSLDLVDVGNFSGKTLIIDYIRDRARKYNQLEIANNYLISNLRKIDYQKALKYNPYFWKHNELSEDFTYYIGDFCVINYYQEPKYLSKALVVFDDHQNAGEILLNMIHDGEGYSLYYYKEKHKLIPYDLKDIKKLTVLDDDLYTIGVSLWR